jgi:c-di-AMP phosphodiesterase-like protein
MLCKYKDIFGIPKQGFHEKRLFGYAFNDVIGTFILAIIVALIFNWPVTKTIIIGFIITIPIHLMFCVETQLIKDLKLDKYVKNELS